MTFGLNGSSLTLSILIELIFSIIEETTKFHNSIKNKIPQETHKLTSPKINVTRRQLDNAASLLFRSTHLVKRGEIHWHPAL